MKSEKRDLFIEDIIQMAEDGDLQSMYILGRVLFTGDEELEISQDIEASKKLIYAAADQGHKGAKEFIGQIRVYETLYE